MNRHFLTTLSVALLVFAATGAAWATGYTCVPLQVYPISGSHGWSLLSNGTVVGNSDDWWTSLNPTNPPQSWPTTWNSSGIPTPIGAGGVGATVNPVCGDDYGRYAYSSSGGIYVWNGTSWALTVAGGGLDGETENGLLVGYTSSTGIAYDLNTKTLYTIGSGATWPISGNASGYVVGQNAATTYGFVWKESTQSYSQINGLIIALGISSNSQYVAGQNQSGQAAVYTPGGSLVGTYWNGEATFVNSNGLVVGDTSTVWNSELTYPSGRAMAEINGQTVDLTTAYAPTGVTFNYCAGVNDAGDILVWSQGFISGQVNDNCHSYLLVPTPEPSALVLLGAGLCGLLAYAWRKRR